jgi:hypothetical protein
MISSLDGKYVIAGYEDGLVMKFEHKAEFYEDPENTTEESEKEEDKLQM